MLVNRVEEKLDRICRLFEKPAFILCFIVILLINQVTAFREADRDLFARLAVGDLVLTSGSVPLHDPFSFTPQKEYWIDHEWLAGVIFQSTYSMLGESGLVLLKIVASCLTVAILFLAILPVLQKRFALAIALTALALDSSYLWTSTVRSQIFTYLALAYLLMSFRRGRLSVPMVSILMLICTNAHGGFIVPLGFIGLYAVYSRQPSAVLAFGLSLICTFLTPYPGITFHNYLFEALTMARPSISEWQPLAIFSIHAILPLLTLSMLGYGAIVYQHKHNWFGLALLVLSAFFGFKSVRLMSIFYFCTIVFGHGYLEVTLSKLSGHMGAYGAKIKRAAAFAMLLLMGFASTQVLLRGARGELFSLTYDQYPVQLTRQMLEKGMHGKLLCDFNLGSYLLWRLYPSFKVAIDGRYEEVYPDSTLALVSDAMSPSSAHHSEALKALSPDYLLLDTRYSDLDGWPAALIVLRDSRFALLDLAAK